MESSGLRFGESTCPVLVADTLSWVSLASMSCGTGQFTTSFRPSFHHGGQPHLTESSKRAFERVKNVLQAFKAEICSHKCAPFGYAINLQGFASSGAPGRASIALWRLPKAATVRCCQWRAGTRLYTDIKVFSEETLWPVEISLANSRY